MKRQPVVGRFGLGLSYGVPVAVVVMAVVLWLSDEPDVGTLVWLGIAVAIGVAVFAMARDKRTSER